MTATTPGQTLVIRGRAYAGGQLQATNIRIEGGTITAISAGDVGPAAQVIELGPRQILLPAATDVLVGLRDWIAAPKERVETATKGALGAGVTVVCDQANIVPRLNRLDVLRERVAFVGEQSYCDYGVAGAPPLNLDDVDHYADAGAYCVGHYSWNLRHWRYVRDLDDSTTIFQRYAAAGMPGSVVVDEAAFQETPMSDMGEGYALRSLLRRLPPEFRMRIQVTQPANVDLILAEKDRLPNVLIQTPHHALCIDRDLAHQRIGAAARHHPPLRSAEEVAQMAAYAREGKIDIVVSWHAPHRMQDKFSADPIPGELTPKAGFTAIDFAYPHLLTRLGVETTCRMYCEAPARALGLKKGLIAEGYEADLVILEEDEGLAEQNVALQGGYTRGVWKVEPMEFFSMGKVTPFTGERLSFRVLKTFLRGQEAFDRETGTHQRRAVRRVEALAT